jgi:heme exporter protein B
MGETPFEVVTLSKALVHWLTSGLPLALIAPLLGFLVNISPEQVLPLTAGMIIGSLGISLLAVLGAAITVGLRRGGPILSLIILPLYVPMLVFGAAASHSGAAGAGAGTLAILGALSLGALVMVPIAASAALKAHLQ